MPIILKYFTRSNFIILFLLIASCFAIFLNLDANYIFLWDEGTYAVNAIEMHKSGDYLVKTYGGGPDMWATNPPLVCYFQTLCMKIFGPGELAVRMPSALAALGVVLLIIRFSIKENLGLTFAVFAVLTLITSKGYITYHVTRTGDLDSVLIFFITGSIMYYYKFIEYEDKKIKYLFIFGVFILLGYFAKGIACFMILPAFFIYTLVKNKTLYVLKTKQLHFLIIAILGLIFLYYYLRELRSPGYIAFAWKSEVGRWYTKVNPNHFKPFFYFVLRMYEKDFVYFFFFIPAFIIYFIFLPKGNVNKNKSAIWILSLFTFLYIISKSSTKLEWYAAPVYPMLAIIMGLGIKSAFTINNYSTVSSYVLKSVTVLAFFTGPYISIIKDDLAKDPGWHDVKFGEALKRYNRIPSAPKKIEMLITGYNGHAQFYANLYNDKFGYEISIRDVAGNITMSPGGIYLFTHPAISDHLKHGFEYDVIMENDGMMAVKIIKLKVTP